MMNTFPLCQSTAALQYKKLIVTGKSLTTYNSEVNLNGDRTVYTVHSKHNKLIQSCLEKVLVLLMGE